MKKILVIGATGQIGSELVPALRKRYGKNNVVAGDRKKNSDENLLSSSHRSGNITTCQERAALVIPDA